MADNPIWVTVLGMVLVALPQVYQYFTRQKSEREKIRVAERKAEQAGEAAVSRAWAEYSKRMEDRLKAAEERLDDAVVAFESCRTELAGAHADLAELKRRMDRFDDGGS